LQQNLQQAVFLLKGINLLGLLLCLATQSLHALSQVDDQRFLSFPEPEVSKTHHGVNETPPMGYRVVVEESLNETTLFYLL
jgi:hypothetical protein